MNLLETRAAELRSDFLAIAHEVGCNPEEIAAVMGDDDGCDSFLIEAEAEARRALAASRLNNRRAIRIASTRKPATRRAPLRAVKKTSATGSGGGGDGDGPGAWHSAAIDQFFDLEKISKLSESFSQVLSRLPDIVFSITRRAEWPTRSIITSWSDSKTGCNGTGLTTLVAHIENIPKSKATERLAKIAVHSVASSGVLNEEEALALFQTA